MEKEVRKPNKWDGKKTSLFVKVNFLLDIGRNAIKSDSYPSSEEIVSRECIATRYSIAEREDCAKAH